MGQSVIVRLHISEGLLSPDKHATVHALLIHPWIKLCCTFVVVCSAYRLKSVFQEMMPTSKGHPVAQKSESCIFLQWLRCVPAATNSVHTNIGGQELWVATYVGEIVGFGKYWPSFFHFLRVLGNVFFNHSCVTEQYHRLGEGWEAWNINSIHPWTAAC